MMGLNVRRNKMLVYMICGGLAGVAGVLLTSRVNSGQPTAAAGWELIAIAAVVIGDDQGGPRTSVGNLR